MSVSSVAQRGDAASPGSIHRLETEMCLCLLVWILIICSSVLCVLMLIGMFRSVNGSEY